MSKETNVGELEKSVALFNKGDLEGYLETLYSPDVALHFLPPGLPPGYEGGRLFYSGFLTGFPGAQLHLDDIVGDDDHLAVRFHVDLTHTGEFNGIPPTGKSAVLTGIRIMRYEDGLCAECWSESDFMGLMQQLGVLPAPDAG